MADPDPINPTTVPLNRYSIFLTYVCMSERPSLETQQTVSKPSRLKKGITRRDFLLGAASAASIGLGLSRGVSGQEKPVGHDVPEKALDEITNIVFNELSLLCAEGSIFDTQEMLQKEYSKALHTIGEKIKKVDPRLLSNEVTTHALQQMIRAKGFILDITDNEMSIKGKNKFVLFVGLYNILSTSHTTVQPYLVPVMRISDDQFPNVVVQMVGPNLIANFESVLKQKAELENVSFRGTVINGEVVLFEKGIQEKAKECPQLTEKEIYDMVLANEMGHVLLRYILKEFKTEEYFPLQFSDKEGKRHSFYELDEAVSDVVQLHFLANNSAAFIETLNDKLGRSDLLQTYALSTHAIRIAVNETMDAMGLKGSGIPQHNFAEFKEKFLKKIIGDVFSTVESLVKYLKEGKLKVQKPTK